MSKPYAFGIRMRASQRGPLKLYLTEDMGWHESTDHAKVMTLASAWALSDEDSRVVLLKPGYVTFECVGLFEGKLYAIRRVDDESSALNIMHEWIQTIRPDVELAIKVLMDDKTIGFKNSDGYSILPERWNKK